MSASRGGALAPPHRRARPSLGGALGLLFGLGAVLLVVIGSGSAFGLAGSRQTGGSGPAFSQTRTVTRTLVTETPGTPKKTVTTVVASNAVTLQVSQTTNLEGRQEIAVSWSGAHPTGGIVANENSVTAQYEEYPMVLLECRGTTSEVSPETCWTQAATERYQQSNTTLTYGTWPPYRLDRYASHASVVGKPATLPTTSGCESVVGPAADPIQYWVPWVSAGGTAYAGGTDGQCGQPPEANGGITSALPSNETFGVTAADGTGSAEFDVFTSVDNGTLGCSQSVACSLVAVPIMGVSCDATVPGLSATPSGPADLAGCEAGGIYTPGQGYVRNKDNLQTGDDLSVSGSLWWSPSNWGNRITVPLTFAPPPNACTLKSPHNNVSVYGSELMIQATSQWDPGFCTTGTDQFSLTHVPVGEPEARNLLATGSAPAAFTSEAQTGGYGRPVVQAPVAVTGFTVSFNITGANGEPVASLKLTPLLLAKLLTESYLATRTYGDPALENNPLNITDDPEFIALNPGITANKDGTGPAYAESELIDISSDSDVVWALTSYIEATPAARAFLNGTPDSSMPGENMVVNPAYKGISLPVTRWPLLSTYESTGFDNGAQQAACLANAPQPFYSLIDAPLANLESVSEAMQFAKPNSTTVCASNTSQTVNSLVAQSRQSPGHYFMLGITPLADDERYDLRPAALQTTPGTFVFPDDASLQAATALLRPDTASGTWPIPYDTFTSAAGSAAYPGTMLVYAVVPTSGLTATDATDLSIFLAFASSAGQDPGSGVGQLPAGYLPITAANGLGDLAAYTRAAAADVAAQNGQVPPLTTSGSGGTKTGSSGQGGSGSSQGAGSNGGANATGVTAFGGALVGRSGGSLLDIAAHLAVEGSEHRAFPHRHAAPEPAAVWLGRSLDVSLWTGGLWNGGGSVVLGLSLAFLIVVLVPQLFLRGRRRGMW